MKISSISKGETWTQIVIDTYNKTQLEPNKIEPITPRFKAMAKQISHQVPVKGELVSIDVKHFIGFLTQYQFSWRK